MTAWDLLVEESSLPDNGINTAWDHLVSQVSGGPSSPPVIILRGEPSFVMDYLPVSLQFNTTESVTLHENSESFDLQDSNDIYTTSVDTPLSLGGFS